MAIELTIERLGASSKPQLQEIDQSLITFGRSKSCHVELEHPEVSRRHFIIKFVDEAYVVIDEGSSHGTSLDGQKLLAHTSYPLASEHEIAVPGFLLKLVYDGAKPKLERTTVVARKLLDELLQGEPLARDCAVLQDLAGEQFSFDEDKTSFSLGSSSHSDFVINDVLVAKRHASFVRDIHGISVIPLPGNDVYIDNELVTETQLLAPGALLKIGLRELLFKERGESTPKTPEGLSPQTIITEPAEEIQVEHLPTEVAPPKRSGSFVGTLDRIFVVAFFLVVVGASAMFFELI